MKIGYKEKVREKRGRGGEKTRKHLGKSTET